MRLKRFRTAQGAAQHWGLAAKACLESLGGFAPEDSLGWVYVTQAFANDLGSIVTFLRETTPVQSWVGGVGFGVLHGTEEIADQGAVVVMVAALPEDCFRLFDSVAALAGQEDWLRRAGLPTGIVHGDPTQAAVDLLPVLAAASGGFLVGGLMAAPLDGHAAGVVAPPGLSGVLLAPPVALAVGLTQGCTPIGGPHTVTEAVDNVIMTVDGRSALQVLREEAGDIIARDLRRAAGYIHAALPVAGSDTGDYTVRSLTGIDPRHGWLALSGELLPGEQVMFVCRDANAAQRDLRRMAGELRRRLDRQGGSVLGALYVSCVARGASMFGAAGRELAILAEELGPLPLIGFTANGEICRDRLYAYTGVLAIFIGESQ